MDAEEILSLQKLAYRSEAEIYNDYRIEPLVQTLEQLQQQFEDHIILKAVVDDAIIGSVRANERDGTCYIGRLMVNPIDQNKGIGRRLIKAIEDYFPLYLSNDTKPPSIDFQILLDFETKFVEMYATPFVSCSATQRTFFII